MNTDVPVLYWRDVHWEREVAFLRITKATPAVTPNALPHALWAMKDSNLQPTD